MLVTRPKWVYEFFQVVPQDILKLGKTLFKFLDFINRKYLTLTFKSDICKELCGHRLLLILVNSIDKFCHWYRHLKTMRAFDKMCNDKNGHIELFGEKAL